MPSDSEDCGDDFDVVDAQSEAASEASVPSSVGSSSIVPLSEHASEACSADLEDLHETIEPSAASTNIASIEEEGIEEQEGLDAATHCEVSCPEIDVVVEAAPPARKKKKRDPVAAAARRVRLRQKKEAKAARKARKRERNQAKKRRGTGQDLEAFLVRTLERLQAKAAEMMAEATRAVRAASVCALEESERASASDLESFLKRSRGRGVDRTKLAEVARQAQQAAMVAQEAAAAAARKLDDFRQKTNGETTQNICPAVPKNTARRRIAIIGAGPVGLWTAVLLAQKHRCGDMRGATATWPDAPEIVIYESRAKEAHCARTDIRIALSPATQQLLNNRARSTKFETGMPIAQIESILLKRLKKISPQSKPIFGHPVNDPASLAATDGFDCVLWASGRRSLEDGLRKPLGCDLRTGDVSRVIVFQFRNLEAGGSIDSDLATAARIATKWQSFRVLMRPGISLYSRSDEVLSHEGGDVADQSGMSLLVWFAV
eukprot:TRINITY_DN23957_c0_g1_i1.p1 TRINITY_DN23957_c0_g1~~TRINITY_DN23957_c0_g1_i1.p1  ORF type:complete len:509 (-),score=77.21 TRINITY_DN23957_c0_g1_i1:46-1515(-)